MPRIGKGKRLRDLLAARGWQRIDEALWNEILTVIPNISPNDLQELEIPVDPPWSGIRQHSLDELESSLCALAEVYAARPDLRRFCRDHVIAAKSRAQYAARNQRVLEARRRIKAEMAEWMLVWLGDPALFPAWAHVRREILNTAEDSNAVIGPLIAID